MAIYLVTPLADNADQVGATVRSTLPATDWHELQGQAGWLVDYAGTSVELCNELGITSGHKSLPSKIGSAMVSSVGTYYGRGPATMWEWLKTRFERA